MTRRQARPAMGLAALFWLAACCGCGKYADFRLPPVWNGNSLASFSFEPEAAPVLSPGDGWDSSDVLNPSVIAKNTGPDRFLNLYSGYDGRTWRTGLATSEDGIHWRKAGMVLQPDPRTWEGPYIAANGSALFDGDQFWYWYQAGPDGRPRIGLARSRDARVWHKEPAPVLETGPRGAWDEIAVADPDVLHIGTWFYLYYLGQDRAARQQIGVARSKDGVHWEKLRSNPILELGPYGAFDERGLGEPAVWAARGFYWMLYTGRDVSEQRRLGLARSTDGVHWRKQAPVFNGSAAWDSKVICDPSVLVDGGTIRAWFGGGDVASPDQNLHGQIGVANLRATLAK
ncbi:MAG TPA: hypothetical protein VG675_02435 [Bryobacteraceae bacterium]|nr:hypothetical protein [Bryobacteraceae bacterium]